MERTLYRIGKGVTKKFNLERVWANVLREECKIRYGLSFRYGGKTVNAIRTGILHYQTSRLSKEEAEKLANTMQMTLKRKSLNWLLDSLEEKSKS